MATSAMARSPSCAGSENMTVEKPRPQPTLESQAYWDGAARGQLVLQQCAACGTVRHYPRLLCSVCYSREVVPHIATGRGKIHSWTVAHHPFHAAFKDELPYTLVTVDLDEGVRALGRWQEDVKPAIGMAVQAAFVHGGSGDELRFAPA